MSAKIVLVVSGGNEHLRGERERERAGELRVVSLRVEEDFFFR